ncbi:MAG: replication-associated recombination protein A [Phycisphaerales bacterium]
MPDLWEQTRQTHLRAAQPLAVRMRPRSLDEFAGQDHFLGEGKLLRRMLSADRLTSVIFYGPPGTGKTTLAELIAAYTKRHFDRANAAAIGVKDVREVLEHARRRLEADGRRTIFFLDEIHRFNRAQQDVLLGDVERGVITLIGATTENPFFAINSPLVSRSQVFQFQSLDHEAITGLLRRALSDEERGYGKLNLQIDDDAIAHWAIACDGDARRALTALEIAVLSSVPASKTPNPESPIHITLEVAEQSIQQKAPVYDGTGDEHYDAASALIKSMRGSDPDAAVYWLAKMLHAGEDPMFIARRVAILASEDVGNADPQAIQVAAAAYDLTHRIGMPECQLVLAQAVTYLATAPKSNAATVAIGAAMSDVRNNRTVPVPKALRDGHYKGAKQLGHGTGYKYAHDSDTGFVDQDYLGVDKTYYTPTERGYEKTIRQYMQWIDAQRAKPRTLPPKE